MGELTRALSWKGFLQGLEGLGRGEMIKDDRGGGEPFLLEMQMDPWRKGMKAVFKKDINLLTHFLLMAGDE